MKLGNIYRMAVNMGKENDVRGTYLEKLLQQRKSKYERLSDEDKKFFDMERLTNPYDDTRILLGSDEEEINTILCGIDMETPEVLLADRLEQRGEKIDLILGHHPRGIAGIALHEVMEVQADMMERAGVPINIGEAIMAPRMKEVERGRLAANHQRAVDAARLLGFSFMCVHSAADNLANEYVYKTLEQSNYSTTGDIIDILLGIAEYEQGQRLKAGPRLIVGDKKRRAGKAFVKFTGGTAGADESYEELAKAGVGTMICMHISEKHIAAAKEAHINVIVAGHMASDSLGMNLFLDKVEQEGVKVIPCSGLIRIKRA